MLQLALMLILPGLADDPVEALEGMGRVRHACTRQMASLDAAVAERPGDRAVALERGLCLHAVGRNDQALPALQAQEGAWRVATGHETCRAIAFRADVNRGGKRSATCGVTSLHLVAVCLEMKIQIGR